MSETTPADLTAPSEPTWADQYHRRVLDFIGGSAEADLNTVIIASGFEPAWQYSEYESGEACFAMSISWQDPHPREGDQLDTPDIDGLYSRHVRLTNEQVANLFDALADG